MRVKLLRRLSRFRSLVDATSLGQKLYMLGAIMFIWGLMISPIYDQAQFVKLFGMTIFSFGLVSEGYSVIDKLWNSKLGKLLLSIVFAAGSTVTVAFSATIVANITGTDPSKFPYTIAIIGLFFLPVYIWLGIIVLSMAYMVLGIVFIPLVWVYRHVTATPGTRYIFRIKKKPVQERYFWLLLLVRFIALGLLVGMLQVVGRFDYKYSNFVTNTATRFLFGYEMYNKTHCTIKDKLEKFAYINAKEVLVGKYDTKSGISFEARMCHEETKVIEGKKEQ